MLNRDESKLLGTWVSLSSPSSNYLTSLWHCYKLECLPCKRNERSKTSLLLSHAEIELYLYLSFWLHCLVRYHHCQLIYSPFVFSLISIIVFSVSQLTGSSLPHGLEKHIHLVYFLQTTSLPITVVHLLSNHLFTCY